MKTLKLEIEIPEVTEEDKVYKWKYNFEFMEKLSDRIMEDSGYRLLTEEIEAVLTALFEFHQKSR